MKKFKLKGLLLTLFMAAALVFAGCSAESSSDDDSPDSDLVDTPSSGGSNSGGSTAGGSGSGTPSSDNPVVNPDSGEEESKTGTVSIVVNVDGSVTCGKCGKKYDTKAEAEACEHYKCETCGTVYYSEEELKACTKHVTVVFNDVTEEGYTSKTSVTVTIKSGDKIPDSVVKEVESWTRDGKVVTWLDSESNVADLTAALSVDGEETTKTVTYTAKWLTAHKVVFKDADGGTNENVTVEVADGATIDESKIPSWTKEHFTLSWSSSAEGVTKASTITTDVTFTAVWTEDEKWLVTYKDAEGGTNADETEYVYDGETPAKVPTWTKDGYNLSWESDVNDVTTTSAIKQAVTFTAVWKELGQWYDTLNLASVTTSDKGTSLTGKFKTAETITVIDANKNKQVFNIGAASSNMLIESNGLKFQSTDAKFSYTTTADSKMVLVFYCSSNNRTVTITAPNNETIIVGRGSSGSDAALTLPTGSTAFTSLNSSATIKSSVVTLTVSDAPKGDWSFVSTSGSTIYIKSVTISELSK